MLKQRILTGVILAAVALIAVFAAGTVLFAWLTGALFLIGAYEWAGLSSLKEPLSKGLYTLIMAGLFWFSWYLPVLLIMLIAVVFWLYAIFLVVVYPKRIHLWSPPLVRMLFGVFVLVPSWLALNVIHESQNGAWVLMSLFLIVWSADIGAYFSGRFWGKRPLMPKVSPKKTLEGFAGGLFLSLLLASLMSAWLPNLTPAEWFALLTVVVLLNIYSVAGDLFESLLKRYCQLKDSGKILPGHGGVMDRIDSLTATAPLFLFGLILMTLW